MFRKISIDIHISDNISAYGFMKLKYNLLLIESQYLHPYSFTDTFCETEVTDPSLVNALERESCVKCRLVMRCEPS